MGHSFEDCADLAGYQDDGAEGDSRIEGEPKENQNNDRDGDDALAKAGNAL